MAGISGTFPNLLWASGQFPASPNSNPAGFATSGGMLPVRSAAPRAARLNASVKAGWSLSI